MQRRPAGLPCICTIACTIAYTVPRALAGTRELVRALAVRTPTARAPALALRAADTRKPLPPLARQVAGRHMRGHTRAVTAAADAAAGAAAAAAAALAAAATMWGQRMQGGPGGSGRCGARCRGGE